MKKSIWFLLLFFSTFQVFSQSRDEKDPIFKPAVIIGMNATQVDGDDLAGYLKVGLNAGGAAYIRLPKNFSMNFEILFSQKGSRTGAVELAQGVPKKLVLDYVDVPLIFNYHDKDKGGKDVAIFGLGFIFNSLVRFKYEDIYGPVPNADNPYSRFGVEATANVIFVVAKKFGINIRFAYSLINIASEPIEISNLKNGGQRNNMLSLRGMYFF